MANTGVNPAERPSRAGGARVLLVIAGTVVALFGFVLSLAGGTLLWAHTTQRDAHGFYASDAERFATPTYALTSNIDLGRMPGEHDWTTDHPVGTVRVRAAAPRGAPLFVGIAPQRAVDTWLAGVPHEHVRGVNFGPFRSDETAVAGTRSPAMPGGQHFWVASTSGTGTRTLLWPSEGGQWSIVVMSPNATRSVVAVVTVGAKTGILLPIGIGLAGVGLLVLAGGSLMLAFGLRSRASATAAAPSARGALVDTSTSYPARLDGHLDPATSRWLWLFKWLLVIPHLIVLAFLWIAVTVLTAVAGIAILITGRYPRTIFDFNVGVMRWTWRVSFYALSAFGTDRYPPFSLRPDPSYSADFDVDYPEHLSRGLVLVKWWLLALPHYLIVAVFAGGWGVGWNGAWRVAGGAGLIAILAVIAIVTLTFRGRYPEPLFDFIMGMNRWCYRVLAYAALLRDEYPPFRLDNGGVDPGHLPVTPPPPSPSTDDAGGSAVDHDIPITLS